MDKDEIINYLKDNLEINGEIIGSYLIINLVLDKEIISTLDIKINSQPNLIL